MDKGWITLHRQLLDKPIWLGSTPEQKVILITLLLMANHREKEWEWQGKPYRARPGQFVTSLPNIAKKCGKGVSIQNVRTALKRFEKYEFLTDESTKQNRLITIVNWGIYQEEEIKANSSPNSQLTDDQQTPNSQLTANNNVNNVNNVTNKKNTSKKSKKRIYSDDDPNKKLAVLLLKLIRENANVEDPNLDDWANTIRLTIERDKHTGREVQDMMIWATNHDFWSGVVLSPSSLRRNWNKMAVQKDKRKPQSGNKLGALRETGDDF